MAYQGILELGVGQIREFEFPRVCTPENFRGTFSFALLVDMRKGENSMPWQQQHSIKNRRSVAAEPYASTVMNAITGMGGDGRHL